MQLLLRLMNELACITQGGSGDRDVSGNVSDTEAQRIANEKQQIRIWTNLIFKKN
jgi:hypothetical protein